MATLWEVLLIRNLGHSVCQEKCIAEKRRCPRKWWYPRNSWKVFFRGLVWAYSQLSFLGHPEANQISPCFQCPFCALHPRLQLFYWTCSSSTLSTPECLFYSLGTSTCLPDHSSVRKVVCWLSVCPRNQAALTTAATSCSTLDVWRRLGVDGWAAGNLSSISWHLFRWWSWCSWKILGTFGRNGERSTWHFSHLRRRHLQMSSAWLAHLSSVCWGGSFVEKFHLFTM